MHALNILILFGCWYALLVKHYLNTGPISVTRLHWYITVETG